MLKKRKVLALLLVLILTLSSIGGVYADSTETNGDYGSLEELFEFIEEELEILVEEIDDADEVMHDLKTLKEETADDLYQIEEVYEKIDEIIQNYVSTMEFCYEIRCYEQFSLFREAYALFLEAQSLSTTDQLKLSFEKYLESLRMLVNLKATAESYEIIINEIANNPNGDYDEDGLYNYFELDWIGNSTDPTLIDTDENGISDADEDLDNDGLTNLEEQTYGTHPLFNDSDFDGLNDYIEIFDTNTDPTNEDPDEDELSDLNEIKYGLDPFVYDTDNDGIKDGDETFNITVEPSAIENDDNVKPSIKIDLEGKYIGEISITNIGESNPYLTNEMPGYIGAPFNFSASMEFENAEMTFEFNKDLINDDFYPAIYYFNPDTCLLELLPDQTVDFDAGTVTTEVTHFSTYALLNQTSVDAFWSVEIMEPLFDGDEPVEDIVNIFGFCIDSSGSMVWNDPNDLRKTTVKNFVDNFDDNDMAAVIDFDGSARTYCQLTSDKDVIKAAINRINSSGGTNITAGMQRAIAEIKDHPSEAKYIILLNDGEGDYDQSLTQQAKDFGIKVYTIGLGSSIDVDLLKSIAETTGGKFYYASNSGELIDIFGDAEEMIDLSKDTDGDGLSDYHEKRPLRTDVRWVMTDVENPDTDGDGLLDGEELTYVAPEDAPYGSHSVIHNAGYFHMNSDPTKEDSDCDGLDDAVKIVYDDRTIVHEYDPEPMTFSITDRVLSLAAGLSYTNVDDKIGMTIGELDASNFKFKGMSSDHLMDMKNVRIIGANNSGYGNIKGMWKDVWDSGLGSLTLRVEREGKKDAIIFVTRGTEPNTDAINDFSQDIILFSGWSDVENCINEVVLPLDMSSSQSTTALEEYIQLTEDYPNAEFYLSGHSLGGRLSQDVFYKVLYKNDGIVFGLWKSNIIVPEHGATFNAFGYIFTDYDPIKSSIKDTIEDRMNNYYLDKDFVGYFLGDKLSTRLGSDIGPWTAMENGEVIDIEKLNAAKILFYPVKAIHGIELFYDDLRLLNRMSIY